MDCRDRILAEDYYDVIVDYQVRLDEAQPYDLCAINVENQFQLLYVERGAVQYENRYFFNYESLPKLYGLMQEEEVVFEASTFSPNNLIVSGITQIQRPPLKLTGKGCVIVFIDTGIRYTEEAFRNADGSSRILAIWDQTIQGTWGQANTGIERESRENGEIPGVGRTPAGLFYGTEYMREDINRALQSENPLSVVPSTDTNGHGTNLAAVAAASRSSELVGAAPEADIVVVKLKPCKRYLREFYLLPDDVPAYEESDIMLGLLYGERFAQNFRRPVIYCIGLGTNYGDHTGSAPLGKYLNALAVKRSRAVVVCSGNEGNAAHHFRGQLVRDSIVTVEVRVGEGAKGFLIEFWGKVPDVFTVAIRSPGGETIPAVRLGIEDAITYGFVYENTRVTVSGLLVEPASGEELIQIRVQEPTAGIWSFQVQAAGEIHNGEFHAWLPITAFMNSEIYFPEPNPYTTITEPAAASDVISVTGYDGANNSFYFNSGRGYTRTGGIKPDFAAPAVDIQTLRGKDSGSSYGAAITAGAVAQFMQWAVVEGNNIIVESREIKNYFIRGASRSYDLAYPNREWGYGRLNMVGTFNALVGI